jgi:cbb3-type cytochrome oxidase cytochrome c subunit
MKNFTHEWIEKNPWLLIGLVLLVISFGGLVEIVPLFFQKSTTEPVAGLKPYSPLRLAGRDIYIREGCYNCHSQMIRPFRAETERYGHYSVAGEFVYDHPFQWGSKRTGPDLARVGGRYSDEWHRPRQPARRGAGIEHARLSLAGEDEAETGRDRAEDARDAAAGGALRRRRNQKCPGRTGR